LLLKARWKKDSLQFTYKTVEDSLI